MINRIKENLTDENIIHLMYTLGAERHIDNEEHVIFPTICHGGDSMKLYYYKNSKSLSCFTSCGSFDIIELVQKVLDVDLKESVNFLAKFLGLKDIYIPKGFGSTNVIVEDFEDEDIEIPIIQNKNIMNNFLDYYCCEWINEGITIETMKKYNIKYYLHQHKIVIPHYNINGELVGIRGRALLTEDVESGKKYMPLFLYRKPLAHSLRHNLYGLNVNLEAIKKYKTVVLVEGEKGVLQTDSYYSENNICLALCGSNLSKCQVKILLEIGVERVIFALDKQYQDEGEEEIWKRKLNKLAKPLLENGIIVEKMWDSLHGGILPYKASPTDLGKETFEYLFNNRITIEEEKKCTL
ncbi:MAG: hypothetical protein WBH31_16780 [Promethearchaeia archaeon]